MDVFTIEAVDMINLTKVMVGHEGEGHGKGWFLDKVIVKESTDAEQQYVFMCERYITRHLGKLFPFLLSLIKILDTTFISISPGKCCLV